LLADGQVDKSRVCAVGDSMLHDVQGAIRLGIDSVFVLCRCPLASPNRPGETRERARA